MTFTTLRRSLGTTALVAGVFALSLTGCKKDAPVATEPAADTTNAAPAPMGGTVADVAMADAQFTTLVDLIQTAGAHRVLTMTLHAPQVHGFFSVPVDHLTATGVLADHFRERDLSNHVVVSPDFGNAKTASLLARLLGLPVAAGSKQRKGDDKVEIDMIVGDVDGKTAIVLDDEIATGGSIVELLDKLQEVGCQQAAVACTHGLFTGRAVERLRGHPMISEVVTTDTVPSPQGWPELKVCSTADLFAEAIARIHAGASISSLFDGVDPAYAPPQMRLDFS